LGTFASEEAMRLRLFAAVVLSCFLAPFSRAGDSSGPRIIRDVEFARAGERVLKLDLHLAHGKVRSPLIVWVHGGAWRSGSKLAVPITNLLADSYAIASVDYRLSPEAKFPAQIHDIKAAIRHLRAHGDTLRIPTKHIVIAGDSAGAHLAALVGVSNGHPDLEGTVGTNLTQRSDVQGIISFYGGANLTTILSQSTPHGLNVRVPALKLLLGDLPTNAPALARLASPVFHVDRDDPPILLLHGDQDLQMPVNQSLELFGVYRRAKASAQLEIVLGAAHGGPMFYDVERMAIVRRFLRQHF
jgi:acetyl esterase/lipase